MSDIEEADWEATTAAYEHVTVLIDTAGRLGHVPVWNGNSLRAAFMAGAKWQQQRGHGEEPALTDGGNLSQWRLQIHTEAEMTERKDVTPEEEYGKQDNKKLGGDSEVPGDEEGAPHTQEQDVGTGPVDKTSDSPPAPTTR